MPEEKINDLLNRVDDVISNADKTIQNAQSFVDSVESGAPADSGPGSTPDRAGVNVVEKIRTKIDDMDSRTVGKAVIIGLSAWAILDVARGGKPKK